MVSFSFSIIIQEFGVLLVFNVICIMGQSSGGMYGGGGGAGMMGGGAGMMGGGGMGGAGGMGGGSMTGQRRGTSGGPGEMSLPPGYANIRGDIMDMSNKVLQRVTAAGTNYFTYENQNGAPMFRRREIDTGRRFVLFPDMIYPPGDGHYIVMRRMPGVNIPGMIPQPLYETFRLSLGDSIHAYVEAFKKDDQPKSINSGGFNGLAASYGGQTSGYGMTSASNTPMSRVLGKRRKRKSDEGVVVEVEMTPIQFTNGKLRVEDVVE